MNLLAKKNNIKLPNCARVEAIDTSFFFPFFARPKYSEPTRQRNQAEVYYSATIFGVAVYGGLKANT